MKNKILFDVKNQIQSNPGLKKKLKILVVIAGVGFILTSTLVIWLGITVFRAAGDYAQDINLKSVDAITTAECLEKAQSLLQVEPWLTKPVSDNFEYLKTACLETEAKPCAGENCSELNI